MNLVKTMLKAQGNIDLNFIAKFATHQKILPKTLPGTWYGVYKHKPTMP